MLGCSSYFFEGGGVTPKSCRVPESGSRGGVPPFWALFSDFGVFPVKTECNPALPGNPSQQRKRHTTHQGSSQVLPRVNLGRGHAGSAKLTLGRTSARTPDGWCTVFSAGLDFLGGQDCTPFSPKIPKKCPKWGYPFFDPTFGNLAGFWGTPSSIWSAQSRFFPSGPS